MISTVAAAAAVVEVSADAAVAESTATVDAKFMLAALQPPIIRSVAAAARPLLCYYHAAAADVAAALAPAPTAVAANARSGTCGGFVRVTSFPDLIPFCLVPSVTH